MTTDNTQFASKAEERRARFMRMIAEENRLKALSSDSTAAFTRWAMFKQRLEKEFKGKP